MKSTVTHILWRIVIGTFTYNAAVFKTDSGYRTEFDKKEIPPLKSKTVNRAMVKEYILTYLKNRQK